MLDYTKMPMKQLLEEYNKMPMRKKLNSPTKAQLIKAIEETKNLYSSKLTTETKPEIIEKVKKIYTPKQLETRLNLPASVIRKKLRKLFPEMAKQGAWKIEEEMVLALEK